MKKLLLLLSLFASIGVRAGSYNDITLYNGDDITYDASWGTFKVIEKDNLGLAAAGDTIIVHVTAISATQVDGQWPNVFLNYVSNGWPEMASIPLYSGSTVLSAPYDAKIVLTDSMANVIKKEGFAVKGSYYTMNSVTLRHVNTTAFVTAIRKEQQKDSACYNLLGMRVEGSYKGVVIRNGKKYIQK